MNGKRTSSADDSPLPMGFRSSHGESTVAGAGGLVPQQPTFEDYSNGSKRLKIHVQSSEADNELALHVHQSNDAPLRVYVAGFIPSEMHENMTTLAGGPSMPSGAPSAVDTIVDTRNAALTSISSPKDPVFGQGSLVASLYSATPQRKVNKQSPIPSVSAKRGRPKKPQLPRPGDPGFIGPLNRRGRKSTEEVGLKDEGTAKRQNKEIEAFGSQTTSRKGTKRKRDDWEKETHFPDLPPTVIPILLHLTGDCKPDRKLQVRHRHPNSRKDVLAHEDQLTLEVDCNGMSRRRAKSLVALFEELVYPFIQMLMGHYRGFHSDSDLQIIGLDVALEILKETLPELIRVRRDPTTHQRTVIKRFVKELFCRKVQGFSRESGSTLPTPSGFSCLYLYKAEENPFYDLTCEDSEVLNGRHSSSERSSGPKTGAKPFDKALWRQPELSNTQRAHGASSPSGARRMQNSPIEYPKYQPSSKIEASPVASPKSDDQQVVVPNHPRPLLLFDQHGIGDSVTELSAIQPSVELEVGECKTSLQNPSSEVEPLFTSPNPGAATVGGRVAFAGHGSSIGNSTQSVETAFESKGPLGSLKQIWPQSEIKNRHNAKGRPWTLGIDSGDCELLADNDGRDCQARCVNDNDSHAETRPQDIASAAARFSLSQRPNYSSMKSLSATMKSREESYLNPISSDVTIQRDPWAGPRRCESSAVVERPRESKIHAKAALQRLRDFRHTAGPTLGLTPAAEQHAISSRAKMSSRGTIVVSAQPILDASLVLLAANIGSTSSTTRYPYKDEKKLRLKEGDEGQLVKHVDFSHLECDAVYGAVQELHGPLNPDIDLRTVQEKITKKLEGLEEEHLNAIARLAHFKYRLNNTRKRKSIRKFLSKSTVGAPSTPSVIRLEHYLVEPDPSLKISSLLRQRELGLQVGGRRTQQELRHTVIDNLALVRSWKGASGDVVCAAWNPNSQTYVFGATATSNAEDLQYNRPNNLLYGDINASTIYELPNHRISRPRPNTIATGPNSSQAVYEACDPMVYKTVTAVQYSSTGCHFYSASHDSTVKVWDAQQNLPECIETFRHDARVTALEASKRVSQMFATASNTFKDSIRVYRQLSNDTYDYVSFESSRSLQKPQHEIYPECLRWGLTPTTEHLLLAGFTRWGDLPDHDPAREGDLCLWDIITGEKLQAMPSAQNIYTAAFHPFLDAFSTGSAPGLRLTHQYTTRSVVRTWDRRSGSPHSMFEYECPALDMQDLVFHPRNPNILAVGCTDGSIYVWDARSPDHPLHNFQHGEPIADWEHKYGHSPMSREQGDGGVNMTLWGAGKHHLYTGATDGAVKCWNIDRAPEDALVRDVAQLQAGISCGSFSPDHISLLVGDSTGGVHILSSNPGGAGPRQDGEKGALQTMDFFPAAGEKPPSPLEDELQPGQAAARELLETDQLTIDPEFGIGQGPAYNGPYAAYAHEDGPPSTTRLLLDYEKAQPVSRKGRVRDNAAARNVRGTIARRREELGGCSSGPEIIELTSDMEDVVLGINKGLEGNPLLEVFEDDIEEDNWFPRMDEEVFVRLG